MTEPLPPTGRGVKVGMAICVFAAAMGFLAGTRKAPPRRGYRDAAHGAVPPSPVQRAPRQLDMEEARYAARRAQQAAALTGLAAAPRTLLEPVTLDAVRYAEEVSARRTARAYDGAPPTIPHAVDQRGAPACLACHAEGLSIDGKVARPMSHPAYTSCTQCHVTRNGPLPTLALLPPSVDPRGDFRGLASAGKGTRAWPGAPPQMPHRSFMRERCVACHGVWATGVASSHPYRQSCTQCHAPAARADQMPQSQF